MSVVPFPPLTQEGLQPPAKKLSPREHAKTPARGAVTTTAPGKTQSKMLNKKQCLLLAALLTGCVAAGGVWLTQSSFLDLDEISVSGLSRLSESEVLEASGITKGDALLSLGLAEARERIVELPWVESVTSQRGWSGSVKFHVTERNPVAALSVPGAWASVDEEGRVLQVQPELPTGLPAVEGYLMAVPQAGAWLEMSAVKGSLEVAVAMNERVHSATRAIRVEPDGLMLDFHFGGRIVLGDSRRVAEKLAAVEAFLTQVDLRCLEKIDVRAPAYPVLTRKNRC